MLNSILYRKYKLGQRLDLLFNQFKESQNFTYKSEKRIINEKKVSKEKLDYLDRLIKYSAVKMSKTRILFFIVCLFLITFYQINSISNEIIALITALIVGFIPVYYLQSKATQRALVFLRDYPTVLNSISSAIKAGLSTIIAIERSVFLLPNESLVKIEIKNLVNKIQRGESRSMAIEKFGDGIDLPDLVLFRSALTLTLEHGGRFTKTLERLALGSRDRENMIRTARVSTQNMRMTANILIVLTPIFISFTAMSQRGYLDTMLNNPVANGVASAGFIFILVGYLILSKFSNFKP